MSDRLILIESLPQRARYRPSARAMHIPSGVYCLGRGDTPEQAKCQAVYRLCEAFAEGAIR